jgi:hypothetical protein
MPSGSGLLQRLPIDRHGGHRRLQNPQGRQFIGQNPGRKQRFHGVARATPQARQGDRIHVIRRPLKSPEPVAMDFAGLPTQWARAQMGQECGQKLGVKLADGIK